MDISGLTQALKDQYDKGERDYYMPPMVKRGWGCATDRVTDNDCMFLCIRRGDRQAQILNAFSDESFSEFPTERFRNLILIPLVEHNRNSDRTDALFATIRPDNTLGHVISKAGLRQLRLGESEKQSHVTYFFSGRRHEPYEGEDRIIVPSPEPWNFASHPGTSTREVVRLAQAALAAGNYPFIFVNLAAGDIMGHIDNWDANVRCAEAVDAALAAIRDAALANGYFAAVTADHGVLERAFHSDGSPSLGHTTSPVPFGLIGTDAVPAATRASERPHGYQTLADVAPTILKLMSLPIPSEMTGTPLAVPGSRMNPKKCVMVLMDGWGIGPDDPNTNPIAAANVPAFRRLSLEGFYTELTASGPSVGLPEGRSGNSETGHLTIGAGRAIPQDELRIATAIDSGAIAENRVLVAACRKVAERNGAVHVLMMLSNKSSHGNMSEGIAVARASAQHGVRRVYLHLIMDGRSTPPTGGIELLDSLAVRLGPDVPAQIATAIGRGYALDRSGKYTEYTAPSYRAIVCGQGYAF